MTGFIVTAPPAEQEETEINGGPFWPKIDPATIRGEQRIDDTITAARLRPALIEAIAETNHALRAFRQEYNDRGIGKLEDIDVEKIDDTSILVHRYKRAVGCLAKAMLLERYKDFDATGKGDKKADALTDPIDDFRRDYLNAIADITGRSRVTVELI